jgi:predicted CoA-binding protein
MIECQFPEKNATEQEVADILEKAETIAVVGISHKEHRDSHKVAKYLKEQGYKLIPVNPKYKEVLGEPCYRDLKSVPEQIDIVDVFRNIEAIPSVVDEAVEVNAGCVWMQLGLCHNEAADKARNAGLSVIMNKCTKIEHSRLKQQKEQK